VADSQAVKWRGLTATQRARQVVDAVEAAIEHGSFIPAEQWLAISHAGTPCGCALGGAALATGVVTRKQIQNEGVVGFAALAEALHVSGVIVNDNEASDLEAGYETRPLAWRRAPFYRAGLELRKFHPNPGGGE
jgi:hypothetical protein